jgi:hypothetical protein
MAIGIYARRGSLWNLTVVFVVIDPPRITPAFEVQSGAASKET